jgi:hypothetical protein
MTYDPLNEIQDLYAKANQRIARSITDYLSTDKDAHVEVHGSSSDELPTSALEGVVKGKTLYNPGNYRVEVCKVQGDVAKRNIWNLLKDFSNNLEFHFYLDLDWVSKKGTFLNAPYYHNDRDIIFLGADTYPDSTLQAKPQFSLSTSISGDNTFLKFYSRHFKSGRSISQKSEFTIPYSKGKYKLVITKTSPYVQIFINDVLQTNTFTLGGGTTLSATSNLFLTEYYKENEIPPPSGVVKDYRTTGASGAGAIVTPSSFGLDFIFSNYVRGILGNLKVFKDSNLVFDFSESDTQTLQSEFLVLSSRPVSATRVQTTFNRSDNRTPSKGFHKIIGGYKFALPEKTENFKFKSEFFQQDSFPITQIPSLSNLDENILYESIPGVNEQYSFADNTSYSSNNFNNTNYTPSNSELIGDLNFPAYAIDGVRPNSVSVTNFSTSGLPDFTTTSATYKQRAYLRYKTGSANILQGPKPASAVGAPVIIGLGKHDDNNYGHWPANFTSNDAYGNPLSQGFSGFPDLLGSNFANVSALRRNEDCWYFKKAITCMSIASQYGIMGSHCVALSPRHGLMATHVEDDYGSGKPIWFMDLSGNTEQRTRVNTTDGNGDKKGLVELQGSSGFPLPLAASGHSLSASRSLTDITVIYWDNPLSGDYEYATFMTDTDCDKNLSGVVNAVTPSKDGTLCIEALAIGPNYLFLPTALNEYERYVYSASNVDTQNGISGHMYQWSRYNSKLGDYGENGEILNGPDVYPYITADGSYSRNIRGASVLKGHFEQSRVGDSSSPVFIYNNNVLFLQDLLYQTAGYYYKGKLHNHAGRVAGNSTPRSIRGLNDPYAKKSIQDAMDYLSEINGTQKYTLTTKPISAGDIE